MTPSVKQEAERRYPIPPIESENNVQARLQSAFIDGAEYVKSELLEWLQREMRSNEGTAEECYQELDNPERDDEYSAKAEALKEVLNFFSPDNN